MGKNKTKRGEQQNPNFSRTYQKAEVAEQTAWNLKTGKPPSPWEMEHVQIVSPVIFTCGRQNFPLQVEEKVRWDGAEGIFEEVMTEDLNRIK